MNYSAFIKHLKHNLYGCVIKEERFAGSILLSSQNGCFINGKKTAFQSIDDAKSFITNKALKEELHKFTYRMVPSEKIAAIVSKYYSTRRITDSIIESYRRDAINKKFALDPVALELRESSATNGRIDYILDDKSSVIVSSSTLNRINEQIANSNNAKYINQYERYMSESLENFKYIIGKFI